MPVVDIGGIDVNLKSSKRAKRLILRSKHDGIHLTKPRYVSKTEAIRFATRNLEWMKRNLPRRPLLTNGGLIGQYQKLIIFEAGSNDYEISDSRITVRVAESASSPSSQAYIEKACIEALRGQTKAILEERLPYWQRKTGLNPNAVRVRHNRTRWGSCSSGGNLSFSLYLAQLESQLLDYVLVHELQHIRHQNHQSAFWRGVEEHIAGSKRLRNTLRSKPLAVVSR